jgi:hypothetical protein
MNTEMNNDDANPEFLYFRDEYEMTESDHRYLQCMKEIYETLFDESEIFSVTRSRYLAIYASWNLAKLQTNQEIDIDLLKKDFVKFDEFEGISNDQIDEIIKIIQDIYKAEDQVLNHFLISDNDTEIILKLDTQTIEQFLENENIASEIQDDLERFMDSYDGLENKYFEAGPVDRSCLLLSPTKKFQDWIWLVGEDIQIEKLPAVFPILVGWKDIDIDKLNQWLKVDDNYKQVFKGVIHYFTIKPEDEDISFEMFKSFFNIGLNEFVYDMINDEILKNVEDVDEDFDPTSFFNFGNDDDDDDDDSYDNLNPNKPRPKGDDDLPF